MACRRRSAAAFAIAAMALTSCQEESPTPRTEVPSPTSEPSPEPQVATFETRLNLLELSGFTCRGLDGPWQVAVAAPSPIEGSGGARFRLPAGRGPGRLRWSFEAQHPGHGLVTYAGDVRVRLEGTEDGPVLFFTGDQTAVGVTSKVFGRARVELGGVCPEGGQTGSAHPQYASKAYWSAG